AKKRIRQNERQRARNRAPRSALKTRLRAFADALSGGDPALAENKFREACKLLDREADHGLIHRNAAARRKSRLAQRLNALTQKASG
ncbi:MAG: 30S ribosomal protein S20, partial [Phycisphaerae bacterium]